MKKDLLQDIFLETSRRLLIGPFTYQLLDSERMGEAEMRNVLVRVLEEKKLHYAIEVATGEPFIHKDGHQTRKALVDLVIYGNGPSRDKSVYVEFKRGHPSIGNIVKDIAKMLGEKKHLEGASFFHYLHKGDYGSENRLKRARSQIIKKYYDALNDARKDRQVDTQILSGRWFYVFILDGSAKEYACIHIESMNDQLCCPDNWAGIS